jgi:hypothetical protein
MERSNTLPLSSRLHSSVGYLPPIEWEANYTDAIAQQASAA